MNKYIAILLIAVGIILVGFLGWSFYQTWIPGIVAICMGGMWIIALLAEDDTRTARSRENVSFRNSRPRYIAPLREQQNEQETAPRGRSLWSRFTSWLSGLFTSRSRTNRRDPDADTPQQTQQTAQQTAQQTQQTAQQTAQQTQQTATERVAPTEENHGSSFWKWMLGILFLVGVGVAWWYFELPWQFIPHAIAVILALYGLAIKDSLSQFHRLTPVLVILTVGLGVVLTPQNPEWAWMLTTGFVPLLIAIAYALANELHHQQSVSAAAVVSFIWMLVYALLTTFDFDPIASLVIGFVIALGSLFWIPEVRERTGVTAPSVPMSGPARWAIGLVVAVIVIIALSNSYGTAWLSNLLEGLPKIAWFVFWSLVLIFMWAQKEQTLKTSTKVWLTILILAIGLYWITVSVLLAIGNFIGGVFEFLTSQWWIMAIVGVLLIFLFWNLLRHMKINPFWVGGIVLLIWILAYSGLFDGTRGISYPVLTPSQGVEQNIDHGPGNDPETLGTPVR